MNLGIEKCPQPPQLSKRARQLFAEAADAGYLLLGWLSVTMLEPLLMAGFSNDDGSITLAFIGHDQEDEFDPLAIDLVCHLEGPKKLTTTTFSFVAPQFDRGVFKYSYPNASIDELLHKHHEQLRALRAKPALFVKTLNDLETSIREYLAFEEQARATEFEESLTEMVDRKRNSRKRRTEADPSDPFAAIRAAGTDGANYDLDTDDVIARLTQWQSLCKFRIVGAEHDTVEIEFDSLPEDLDAFVRELYDFCPDLVEQGTGCAHEMLAMMEEAGQTPTPEMLELIEGVDFEDEEYGLEILKRELQRKKGVQLWWD